MTSLQKKQKVKKVRETYLKFRYRNLEPRRKEQEQAKEDFIKLLNMKIKLN